MTGTSKIEQTINDIYALIDNCKYAAFSNKESIIVNKEDITELLEELRDRVPEEIKIYQKMIVNRDTIIEKAKKEGERIVAEAQAYQNEMVNENEIMQQAYAQANEIVTQARMNAQELLSSATNDANNYQMSAVQYTDDSLADLQDIISRAITSAEERYSDLLSALNDAMNRVSANRAQLSRQIDHDMGVSMPSTATVSVEPLAMQQGQEMGMAAPETAAGNVPPVKAAPARPSGGDGVDIL